MPKVTRPSLAVFVFAGSGVVCACATPDAPNTITANRHSRLTLLHLLYSLLL